MGQVPEKNYLIIGSGRLATHLAFYLNQQSQSFSQWSRRSSLEDLNTQLANADVVLLAISDDFIVSFYEKLEKKDQLFVHFSGKLYHPKIFGFHPLMTFSLDLYDENFYSYIPFVGDVDEVLFRQTFPQWPNPYYKISSDQKDLYHSLCVLSGNGTTLLWELFQQKVLELGLPSDIGDLFLLKISQNIIQQKDGRLTGPWYRNDRKTIQSHLSALKEQDLDSLYSQFYQLSQKIIQGDSYGGCEPTQ